MQRLTSLTDEARMVADTLAERAGELLTPTIRLGVTGLSRAGKTIFITALLDHLINRGRLPLFEPLSSGRISKAYLEPQPDDTVARFDYEQHLDQLSTDRTWPQSTRTISEMRLTVEFESTSYLSRLKGKGKIHIDIIDYPGEWLLDLPLLGMTYQEWCQQALEQAGHPARETLSQDWRDQLEGLDPQDPSDETIVRQLSEQFTAYLNAARADRHALSYLPPGRFLMPGDLAGSPALTFCPLILPEQETAHRHSLWAMMERRYESYKKHVITPFFRNHFARLDRQIVLVDLLNAANAGPDAIKDLEHTLDDVLMCFRPGKTNWLTGLVTRRIDRVLFAATKADHLHQADHDRLSNLLRYLVDRSTKRAKAKGAGIDVTALASVRATREAEVQKNGTSPLPAIIGTPLPGEQMNGEIFDGTKEIGIFPGDLPDNPAAITGDDPSSTDLKDTLKFIRFRPPERQKQGDGQLAPSPHIRLDKALQFLLGDDLK